MIFTVSQLLLQTIFNMKRCISIIKRIYGRNNKWDEEDVELCDKEILELKIIYQTVSRPTSIWMSHMYHHYSQISQILLNVKYMKKLMPFFKTSPEQKIKVVKPNIQ